METKATPELLNRLNEIVERSRLPRDKKTPFGDDQKPAEIGSDASRRPPYPRRAPPRS